MEQKIYFVLKDSIHVKMMNEFRILELIALSTADLLCYEVRQLL